jgi:hypothetical protein
MKNRSITVLGAEVCGGPGRSGRFFGFLSGRIVQFVVAAVGM